MSKLEEQKALPRRKLYSIQTRIPTSQDLIRQINAAVSLAYKAGKADAKPKTQGKESEEEMMITKAEIVAALTRFGPVKSFIVGALAGFVLGAILF